MHPNTIYALIRSTIRKVLGGGVGPFEPKADEDLESLYGLDITARRALYKPLNNEFSANGTPLKPVLTPTSTADQTTVRKLRKLIEPRVPVLFIAAMIGMLGSAHNARSSTNIDEYNTDGDKSTISYQEMIVYFANKATVSIGEFDKNKNGMIDPSELDEFNKKLHSLAEEEAAANFASTPQETGLPIAPIAVKEAMSVLGQKPKVPPTPAEIEKARIEKEAEDKRTYSDDLKFYLRKSGRDVSIRADKFDGNGANFSYKNNAISETASGRVTAAFGVLRELRLKDKFAPATGPYISALTYGGSIAIDRSFESRGKKFETNALELRGGGDLEIAGLMFPVQYLSAWGYLKTDTEFERKVVGAEAVYEPFSFAFLRGFTVPHGRIIARLAPSLFGTYERVLSDGGVPSPYDDYLNVGYGLTAELAWIRDGKRVSTLTSEFRDSWNVTGDNEHTYDWANRLAWTLDDAGNVTLNLDYELSQNELTEKRTNEVALGIGLRY
ncbi:hypothetical protein [Mesorhizobium neociceri]|uniref:EF-hand domain-containing protein n=1 Tax=Mesorhizobium neociceri TaxID=1307853 RepID=A0A838AZI8_9HYPH|nr:hypothetical protein [Mesorhizobium neociceri]MBA1139263.1 hypothetical protein [Mesorhizobium neociceri]